ncbi:aminopeptidase P family protein [Pseudooceanicola sp. CBS1P-1]|uniref:M24 family metallopeptidase n=1 Tax=Pseudooceanicola albus TaxID=2692189 RepID=A0A6L7G3D2_9RHOB|nr:MULTISPECIES: aminopeptidase P family protein [Pseudooceanicola]MBT9382572.1 aminopeptidase P family protein [Pseudooceanicola endophyticus]MXN17113.1 M24 family metallopeptidase [Pseudooceanicola albus]
MFQSFETSAAPEQGPPRLAALRAELKKRGLDAFLVPRADAHQGEYVAPCDERLAWLTGFTGSAGFCLVTAERAAVFADGRYTVQVRAQVAQEFEKINWPATSVGDWARAVLPQGATLAYDPWLHSHAEITRLTGQLSPAKIRLVPVEDNPLDAIWPDRPAPPMGPIVPQPLEFAGEPHADKCARLGRDMAKRGQVATVLTLPDSIAWLLNIRGSDIPRNPIPHAFAILHAGGEVTLFAEDAKCDDLLIEHLGPGVTLESPAAFGAVLEALAKEASGAIRLDPGSCPVWVEQRLSGAVLAWEGDPCVLPKACKNAAELAGSREAHLRDAAAMCHFLAWFDAANQPTLTEIDLVTRLEIFRRETNALMEISFDTIAGAGPNGALPHYHVSRDSSRQLENGQLVVLDSGGQYLDGTTDITRTLLVGDSAGPEEIAAYTRVLKGMIAISRLRFPQGLAGQHLDALARYPLWLAGMDFDHGTGHGVGAYLCVHEGPQRLSRMSDVPFRPGMILSNEPGYYREGAFGIRTENLLVVQEAPDLPGADPRPMYAFETLTWVPLERRLIDTALLAAEERAWIDDYHATCREKVRPRLDEVTALWLDRATAPL